MKVVIRAEGPSGARYVSGITGNGKVLYSTSKAMAIPVEKNGEALKELLELAKQNLDNITSVDVEEAN